MRLGGGDLMNTPKAFSIPPMTDYPVTLTPDGGTVLVTFADVPEAITFGMDEADALLQAADALASALALYVGERKPLPTPSTPAPGQRTVRPSEVLGW